MLWAKPTFNSTTFKDLMRDSHTEKRAVDMPQCIFCHLVRSITNLTNHSVWL